MTGKEDDEFCREQLSGERSSASPERELTEQVEGQETVLQVEGLDKGSDEGLAETRVIKEQVVGPVQLEGLGKGPEEGLDKGLAETEVTAEVMEGEEGPLLAESRLLEAGKQMGEPELIECRICQEEDEPANLDMPCACTGSVKYAHPKCVQRWSNEKGDAVCEICHQPYKGYTAVPRPQPPVSVALPLEFADDWALAGQRLSDPRLLHQYALDVDYNEYDGHASTTAWCRSAALIFMALLLLRHALGMIAAGADDDESPAIFTVFLLKAIGFILPCYIMARAISIAQRRRQQQDAMAYFVQQGHVRGVPIVVAPRRLPEGVV